MAEKVSQESASYRPYAKGSAACAKCTMFRPMNSCITVRGTISPFGWCKFFKAKKEKAK